MLLSEESIPQFPQFVELFSLFPKAEFVLFDKEARLVDNLSGQLNEGCMSYDPFMLRIFSSKNNAPEKFQTLFHRIKNSLSEVSIFPKNAARMLQGYGEVNLLQLSVPSKSIEVRELDVMINDFKSDEQSSFDVVVATMSISCAISNGIKADPAYNYFGILLKTLKILKVGGMAYIDLLLFEVLEKTYQKQGFELGIEYIEMMLGHRLIQTKIPISDFLPQAVGSLSIIDNMTKKEAQSNQRTNVSSASIWAIKRSCEEVKVSYEEKTRKQLSMIAMLKSSVDLSE